MRCYTRTGQDWTDKFRPIAEAFRAMDLAGALIDGEVVAFAPDGRTDFSTLQKTLTEGGPLDFFAFDLLEEDGEDITKLRSLERKSRLQALLDDLPKDKPHPLQHAYRGRRAGGAREDLRRRPRGHRLQEGVRRPIAASAPRPG